MSGEKEVRAIIAILIFFAAIYFADDFAREFGIRALPVGALAVLSVCYAIVQPKPRG